MDERGENFV